jgi:accessory gene regulator B
MEKIAESIVLKLNKHLNKEGLELQKMKLGIEILLINVS